MCDIVACTSKLEEYPTMSDINELSAISGLIISPMTIGKKGRSNDLQGNETTYQ